MSKANVLRIAKSMDSLKSTENPVEDSVLRNTLKQLEGVDFCPR